MKSFISNTPFVKSSFSKQYIQRHCHAAKVCRDLYFKPQSVDVDQHKGFTYVAIEGSDTITDWIYNMLAFRYNNVHFGFNLYCNSCIKMYDLKKKLNEHNNIIICGHSLGAVAAILLLNKVNIENVQEVVVFGCPKFCDSLFMQQIENALNINNINLFSYVNGEDIITKLPPDGLGYVSLRNQIELDNLSDNPTPFRDHSMTNYVDNLTKFLSQE